MLEWRLRLRGMMGETACGKAGWGMGDGGWEIV